MTIDKLDPVWAESGDITPPATDEKIETGWVGGDKPRMQRLNLLQNRAEVKLNKIQRERIDSFYTDAADAQLMLSTGQWTESWGTTRDSLNLIDGGDKAYVATCVTFGSDNEPSLLVYDDTLFKVEKWDARDLTLTDTSPDLTNDLPVAAWQGISMCTDSTSIYAMFRNTATSAYQIQAWDIATWNVKSGWSATGTTLTGTGLVGPGLGEVIIASATRLATFNYWNTVVNNTTETIEIININTGAIEASGAGDAPAGVPGYSICSDGTNIFFNVVETAGPSKGNLCTATIADPTTGCGGVGYPLDCGSIRITALVSCGPELIISCHQWTNAAGDILIRTHSAAQSNGDSIIRGVNSAAVTGDQYICHDIYDATFDGLNVWLLVNIDNLSAGLTAAFVKIDASKFIQNTGIAATDRQLEDIASGCFILNPTLDTGVGSDLNHSDIVFDGRDIWVAPEPDSGQTYSGHIYRLPLALLRS